MICLDFSHCTVPSSSFWELHFDIKVMVKTINHLNKDISILHFNFRLNSYFVCSCLYIIVHSAYVRSRCLFKKTCSEITTDAYTHETLQITCFLCNPFLKLDIDLGFSIILRIRWNSKQYINTSMNSNFFKISWGWWSYV